MLEYTPNPVVYRTIRARNVAVSMFAGLATILGCTYETGPPQSPCAALEVVSFAGDILPLLDNHCNACHSASGGSGLNLTDYDDVAESALEGSLIERLKLPESNIQLMPQGGPPLPECDIALFEAWADNGAPNN